MISRKEQSELYGKYAPVIYGRCRRFLRTMDEAQEAVGEVFNRLLEDWDTLQEDGSVHYWIHKTTIRMCLAELRRVNTWVKKGQGHWDDDERFSGISMDGRKVMDALLDRTALPWEATTREVALYAIWDGYGAEAISTLTGIALAVVETHLARSREWVSMPDAVKSHAPLAAMGLAVSFA